MFFSVHCTAQYTVNEVIPSKQSVEEVTRSQIRALPPLGTRARGTPDSSAAPSAGEAGKMSEFRSAEMSLIQMFVSHEAAHDTLHELGEIGVLQFKDLNSDKSAFQRLFVQVPRLI